MKILSVVIPVRYPTPHVENLKRLIESGLEINANLYVVFDLVNIAKIDNDLRIFLSDRDINTFEGVFGGPGSARNIGLRATQTDWVTFWDCDDQVDSHSINLLQRDLSRENDLIIAGYSVASRGLAKTILPVGNSLDTLINPGMWRFIFRREFLDGIEFTSLALGEDQIFIYNILNKHPKIFQVQQDIYRYNKCVSGQITQVSNRSSVINSMSSMIELMLANKPIHQNSCYACDLMTGIVWKSSFGLLRRSIAHPVILWEFPSLFKRIIGFIWGIGVKANVSNVYKLILMRSGADTFD